MNTFKNSFVFPENWLHLFIRILVQDVIQISKIYGRFLDTQISFHVYLFSIALSEFHDPVNTGKFMLSWSVNLFTLILGSLSPSVSG